MTVSRLLHEMEEFGDVWVGSMDELAYWRGYERIEMFGYEVENYRAGVIASTVANVQPGRRKSLKPSDFYPKQAASVVRHPRRKAIRSQREA